MQADLVLAGFGNVARRFVRLLDERTDRLRDDHDLTWRVIGIATRRHGSAHDPAGLDVRRALEVVEGGEALTGQLLGLDSGLRRNDDSERTGLDGDGAFAADHGRTTEEFIRETVSEAVRRDPARLVVVVETTVLNIERGQPATDHVRAALEAGAHVISANKGPVAFAARELLALAAERRRAFFFEGAVMDGIPIFNLVRETLPAVTITGFRGVVNSTTNHILTAMEAGGDLGPALAEMQAAGIAEADASLDVDGWDAAAKTAALINVLMGGEVTPHDVARTGIGDLTGATVRDALARNRRVKLVASATRERGRVSGRVAPEELPASELLATLDGQQNALVLQTDLVGDIAIVQRGSGLTQTAYALISDLVAVRRRISTQLPGR